MTGDDRTGADGVTNIVRRAAGAVLVVSASASALLTVVEHLYRDVNALGYSTAWDYVDPLTAAGVALGLVFTGLLKRETYRAAGVDRVTRRCLETNVLFYGFLFVGILFYRLWFGDLTGHTAFPVADDVTWNFVYGLYPLLAGALGVRLLRDDRES